MSAVVDVHTDNRTLAERCVEEGRGLLVPKEQRYAAYQVIIWYVPVNIYGSS